MLSLAVNIWIGNAAAVLCGRWGAVTRRAREVGYSRMAIYHHAQRVTQAVVNEQEGGASSEALWAENARLRATPFPRKIFYFRAFARQPLVGRSGVGLGEWRPDQYHQLRF